MLHGFGTLLDLLYVSVKTVKYETINNVLFKGRRGFKGLGASGFQLLS